MLLCVRHLNMNMVSHDPCSTKSSKEMQTSVSPSSSLHYPYSFFLPIPNISNFKPLSISSQQTEPFPSQLPPHNTKPTPGSILNHPKDRTFTHLHFNPKNIDLAPHVFDQSPHRESSTIRLEQAMRSMIWVKRFNLGVATVASALPICAKLRALKQGKELHAYALKRGIIPHVSIVSSLMVLYSKCGVIEYSMRLFDGLEKKNVILWTAMIDSCVENGCFYEALGVIRSMQLTKHKADTVTFARMLCVCGELRVLKLGKEVHGQVLKRDFESIHYVAAEVINMYGVCGDFDKAKLVFDAVPVKGSMTWTALIRAYGYKEWYQDAVDLFDHMILNGCSPNVFTFEAVLSICDRGGFVEDAFRIFDLMSRYKIEASKEHCTIMIRLLTRYGKLDEALRFVEMSYSL